MDGAIGAEVGSIIAGTQRQLNPVVLDALTAAHLSETQITTSAGLAALEHRLSSMSSNADLSSEIVSAQATIAALQHELADAAIPSAPTVSTVIQTMDFSAFGTGMIPDGTIANVPGIGKVKIETMEGLPFQIIDGWIVTARGEGFCLRFPGGASINILSAEILNMTGSGTATLVANGTTVQNINVSASGTYAIKVERVRGWDTVSRDGADIRTRLTVKMIQSLPGAAKRAPTVIAADIAATQLHLDHLQQELHDEGILTGEIELVIDEIAEGVAANRLQSNLRSAQGDSEIGLAALRDRLASMPETVELSEAVSEAQTAVTALQHELADAAVPSVPVIRTVAKTLDLSAFGTGMIPDGTIANVPGIGTVKIETMEGLPFQIIDGWIVTARGEGFCLRFPGGASINILSAELKHLNTVGSVTLVANGASLKIINATDSGQYDINVDTVRGFDGIARGDGRFSMRLTVKETETIPGTVKRAPAVIADELSAAQMRADSLEQELQNANSLRSEIDRAIDSIAIGVAAHRPRGSFLRTRGEIVELVQSVGPLQERVNALTEPWFVAGRGNRLQLLNDRAASLTATAAELTALGDALAKIERSLEGVAKADIESVAAPLPALALQLASSIAEWQRAERSVWDEGLGSLSPSLRDALIDKRGIDALKILATPVDASVSVAVSASDKQIIRSLTLPDDGGTLRIEAVRGTSPNPLSLTTGMTAETSVMMTTAGGTVLDLTQAATTVLAVSFTPVSSAATDTVTVLFLRGNDVLSEQTVKTGAEIRYENIDGITGVLVKNAHDTFSDDVRAFDEYRRMYYSDYLYPWQDPGSEASFFGSVRKDLAPRRAEIVASANRGEQSHTLSLTDLRITRDLSVLQSAVPALSPATNREIAKISAPRIDSVLPDVHGMFQLDYNGNAYNRYTVKQYDGNPTITGVRYKAPSGTEADLPPELYSFDGTTLIIYPMSQTPALFVTMDGASNVKTSSGMLRNFDIVHTSGDALTDVLPSPGPHIIVEETTAYNQNQGGEPGWRSGAGQEDNHKRPNAVGSAKMSARFSNDGSQGVNFMAYVYSGREGTPGSGTVQAMYKGSLGAGESRTLVTAPIGANPDAAGASMIRIVLVDDHGKTLATAEYWLGAANMSDADQAAHMAEVQDNQLTAAVERDKQTREYFAGIGQSVPAPIEVALEQSKARAAAASAEPAPAVTLDPAVTERVLRTKARAQYAALQSGDPARIELETRAMELAAADHERALGSLTKPEDIVRIPSIPAILAEETATSERLKATAAGKTEGMRHGLEVVSKKMVAMGMSDVAGSNVMVNRLSDNNVFVLIGNDAKFTDNIPLSVNPGKSSFVDFSIDEDKMVNFGVQGMSGRDLTLTISGGGLGTQAYSSQKNGITGESVSLKLPKGTYTLTVRDDTNYGDMVHAPLKNTPFDASVQTNIQKYNSANIEGLISTEGSEMVMPVSMRVAEFDLQTGERSKNYSDSGINKIVSTKPVWVVIHGRTDYEDSDSIAELARTLGKMGQVMTLDWSQMAKENALPISLDGSLWIDRVATWATDQLKSLGFTPDQINLAGHSWGTYVNNSIAMKLGHVNTLVALDPAADGYLAGVLGNQYKTETIDFAKYSNHSLSILSSNFGSGHLAKTANKTISLAYPENYTGSPLPFSTGQLINEAYDETCRQHGFAVTAFSAILDKAMTDPYSAAAKLLPLKQLTSSITRADDTDRMSHVLSAIPHFDGVKKWWKAYPNMNQLDHTTSW